jgi:hypothetical protein
MTAPRPDDERRFEDELRRRLRADAAGTPLELTASELERTHAERRRRARDRSWLGIAAVGAFVLVGALAIGPAGLLQGPAGVGGPSASPGGTEVAASPSLEPAPSSLRPDPSAVAGESTPPPGTEGEPMIELARVAIAPGDPRTVRTLLPGSADAYRLVLTCSGTGIIEIVSFVTLKVACAAAAGDDELVWEFTPDETHAVDLAIEASGSLEGLAVVTAIDRDAPVGGFVAPRLAVSSPTDPGRDVAGARGLVHERAGIRDACPARFVPVIPDERQVIVTSRDPLTLEIPGWTIDSVEAAYALNEDLLADPATAFDVLDEVDAETAGAVAINTPPPGQFVLRLLVRATSATGETFSMPYFVRIDSQGRG